MDLSIIIVNWNSGEYAVKCISSVLASTSGLEYEIVVIDNASPDGSSRMIAERFPNIKIICSHKNLGFARANNLALDYASGRNVLFLNPDTELVGNAIGTMFRALELSPDLGVIGPKLLNPDLSVQTSAIQPFPTILNQLLDSEWLQHRWPESRLWKMAPLFGLDDEEPKSVDVVPGTALMMRRAVFEEVGLFSTDYFMYTEDIDLCHRVRQAGWKVAYLGTAEVIHYGGQSSKQRSEDAFSAVLMRQSVWKFLRKTRGRAYAAFHRVATALVALTRIAILSLSLVYPLSKIKRRAVRTSIKKWHKILAWSLGAEPWAARITGY